MLGLSPMDVGSVHSKLAEESFRHQVQAVIGDGIVNKERMDALAGARRRKWISNSLYWPSRCHQAVQQVLWKGYYAWSTQYIRPGAVRPGFKALWSRHI